MIRSSTPLFTLLFFWPVTGIALSLPEHLRLVNIVIDERIPRDLLQSKEPVDILHCDTERVLAPGARSITSSPRDVVSHKGASFVVDAQAAKDIVSVIVREPKQVFCIRASETAGSGEK